MHTPHLKCSDTESQSSPYAQRGNYIIASNAGLTKHITRKPGYVMGDVNKLDGDSNEAQMLKLHIAPIRQIYVHAYSCDLVPILMPLHMVNGAKHSGNRWSVKHITEGGVLEAYS